MITSIRGALAALAIRKRSSAIVASPRSFPLRVLELLESRDAPVTDLYVTSGADSGPGTLRAAIAAIVDNDPTTIHLQVEIIELESALESPETGIVEIIGEFGSVPWTEIRPVEGDEHEFRFLLAGIGNNGHFLLRNLGIHSFGSSENGGAVRALGELVVEHCTFSNNVTAANGGAISSEGLDLTITNSSFSGTGPAPFGNMADGYGGAIYFVPSGSHTLEITSSSLSNNFSDTGGGAVYSLTLGTTVLGDVQMLYNSAPVGSALYHVGGILQIANSPGYGILFNQPDELGDSAIYCLGSASIWIDADIRYNNYCAWDIHITAPQGPIYINTDRVDPERILVD